MINSAPRTLIDVFQRLVEIDSVTGKEQKCCDYIEQTLSPLTQYKLKRIRHNLIIAPKTLTDTTNLKNRPRIGLAGHLDTVPKSQNGPVRIEKNRLYGVGSSDMKSGVATMVHLLKMLDSKKFSSWADLIFIFYDQEEGPFDDNGLGILLQEKSIPHLELAICLEPTNAEVHLGAVGSIHARLTFEGKKAHSARPWHGENAIYKAGRFLTELEQIPIKAVSFDKLTFYEVCTPTMVFQSGVRNVVPNTCTINLNYRFAPEKSLESAQQDMLNIVSGRAKVTFEDLSPSANVWRDNPLVERLISHTGGKCQPKQAWTDVARFSQVGIPAINYGPGDPAQAHQHNEYQNLDIFSDYYYKFMAFLEQTRSETSLSPSL